MPCIALNIFVDLPPTGTHRTEDDRNTNTTMYAMHEVYKIASQCTTLCHTVIHIFTLTERDTPQDTECARVFDKGINVSFYDKTQFAQQTDAIVVQMTEFTWITHTRTYCCALAAKITMTQYGCKLYC